MAGLVLSIGKESQNYFDSLKQNFGKLKGLCKSFECKKSNYQIIKYKRLYDNDDSNYFNCAELNVNIVGSVLYKNFGFNESAKEIGKSMLKGESISKIADEIDGHHFISIFLKNQNRVYLITDCGGVINTYLLKKDENIYISTSMLALAKTFTVTPDADAILTFIRSGVFFNETTYFKEISVLKPASIYEYKLESGQFTRNKYWSVPKDINRKISFKAATDSITKSLMYIIDKIPISTAIYDLTGGYDSRFVLALAYSKETEKNKINAFFFGPVNSREARIVEKNCKNLKINYNNYTLPNEWSENYFDSILEANRFCDGLENACAYAPILWVLRKKKKEFQVSVNGLIGELFRQRTWEFEFGRRGKRIPANVHGFIKYRDLGDAFDRTVFSEHFIHFINAIPNILYGIYKSNNRIFVNNVPNTLQIENIFFSSRRRRHGRNVTTSNQIIQTICPLWFRKPIEISFSLSPEFKKRCKLMRFIVEKTSPEFAKEKMINNTPFVLMNLTNIHRFIPGVVFFVRKAIRKFLQVFLNKTIWSGLTTPDYKTGEWFRQALKDPRCQDLLNYEKMLSKSFYDERGFNEFIQRAKTSEFHFYGQLGNIITTELTLRAANIKRN
jgi:asparagine synthetase B (glutamine-hydrolysing)